MNLLRMATSKDLVSEYLLQFSRAKSLSTKKVSKTGDLLVLFDTLIVCMTRH